MAIMNHMSDVPYSKKSTEVEPYIEAFDIINDSIDFNVLDDYKESKYVNNAYNLEEISDTIDNIQNDWNDNVIENLSDKQVLYQSWINNFKSAMKSWQSGSSNLYYKNEIVTYTNDPGAIFLCIQDCNGSQSLPNASSPVNSYWARFYSKGIDGENSCDLQWRGEWNIANVYSVGDVVYYSTSATSTSFYVCLQSADGQNISDTQYWDYFYVIYEDTILIYNSMPDASWFSNNANPTIFGLNFDSHRGIYFVKFINRIESPSRTNPAYVDMGSDISSLLIYQNDDYPYDIQIMSDVWDSFIKDNNIYSNVRR